MNDVELNIVQEVIDVTLEIDQSGAPGQGVPVGGNDRDVLTKTSSVNYATAWEPKYYDYLINVEYTGAKTNIANGRVLTATIEGRTIYRFINNTRNANGYPVEDSFYNDFDGTNLSNLIITRV